MEQFIIEYWVEVLFGLICLGFGAFFKLFRDLVKKEYAHQKEELLKSIDLKMEQQQTALMGVLNSREQGLREADKEITNSMNEIKKELGIVKNGSLSIQGRAFKEDCRKMLTNGYDITLNDFENISNEHIVYNSLGGNHEGDALFKMVEVKYKNTLNNGESEK